MVSCWGLGDQRSGKAAIREGFSKLLAEMREKARSQRVRWNIVACGSTQSAVEDYRNVLGRHPAAINVLLVDSDVPVALSPKEHLKVNGGVEVSGIPSGYVHLMVQIVEAWLVSDADALARFYGPALNVNVLPKHINIEQVAKADVYRSLNAATRNTVKGVYHKIRHGPKILAGVNVNKVRARAPHCDRFFNMLEDLLEEVVR
jgi:hypothetical protein